MALDIDLQTYLSSLVDCPVQENKTDEDQPQPFVVWQRSDTTPDLFLSGQSSLTETDYTIGVYGLDPDATAAIADTLKTSLNGYFGTMETTPVLGMFISAASDDYIPKLMNADIGFHSMTFLLKVVT